MIFNIVTKMDGRRFCFSRDYGRLRKSIRPVLVVNVFLITHPHAIWDATCFGHYCHYLALCMLSSIIKINVSILSLVCPGIVQIVQDMLR